MSGEGPPALINTTYQRALPPQDIPVDLLPRANCIPASTGVEQTPRAPDKQVNVPSDLARTRLYDMALEAALQSRVRPLSDSAAAALGSFTASSVTPRMPFRPPHRRVEHGDEEKDEHEAGSDDDLPSLYESSDRESTADVDDYEDEARRYIRYQLSAAPEAQFHRAPAISASTFYANSRRRAVDPAVHPQFRSKTVCELFCGHCDAMLCRRGMSAILLGDTTVNLYSTDARPQAVELVGAPYTTSSCNCLIHDAACHLCGNVIAYNVTKPCEKCLRATHNGHLWIFATEGIRARERLDSTGMRLLRWSHLPPVDQDGAQSGDGSGTQAQNGSVRAKGRRKAADLFVNR